MSKRKSTSNNQRVGFAKDSTLMLASRFLLILFALLSSVVISRILEPSGKGSYGLVTLVLSLTVLVFLFGLGSATVYFGVRQPEQLPALAGNIIFVSLLFGSVGILLVELLSFHPLVQDYLHQNSIPVRWVRWIIFVTPLNLFNAYAKEIVRAVGDIFMYGLLSLLNAVVLFATTIILLWGLNLGVKGAICGYLIATVLVSIVTAWQMNKKIDQPFRMNLPLLKQTLQFGLRLYPSNLAQFLNYRLDVFVVGYYLSDVEVGLYLTATTLAERFWELPNAVRTALYHRVAEDHGSDSSLKITLSSSRIIFVVVGLFCIMFALLSHWVMLILYGVDYLPASLPFTWLMPGIWALSLGKLWAIYLAGSGYPEYGSISSIVSLILTICLDFMLIPKVGIVGAAIASSVAYFVTSLILGWLFVRKTGTPWQELLLLNRTDWHLIKNAINRGMSRVKQWI